MAYASINFMTECPSPFNTPSELAVTMEVDADYFAPMNYGHHLSPNRSSPSSSFVSFQSMSASRHR